jgi:hypothetical protein
MHILLLYYVEQLFNYICVIMKKILKLESWLYLRGFILIIILDSLIIDDEPLWEPIEWSLVQTWILFLFLFAWSAEVIFSSRYGSYTNRDKIVWIGLYKVYWLMQWWFVINLIIVTIFVTMPFYYEITYSISYLVLWWNWYNTVFFFKLILVFTIIIYLTLILKYNIRWVSYTILLYSMISIFILLSYLFYFMAITTLFGFFSDIYEYTRTGWIDLYRIVHGPLKWNWGLESRDHFSYHKTTLSFWYKNDPLIAASMFFINLFLLFFFFFFLIQIITLIRIIYSSKILSYNLITLFYTTLKHFFLLLSSFFSLILLSFIYHLIRFPFELYWFNCLLYLSYIQGIIIVDFISLFFSV